MMTNLLLNFAIGKGCEKTFLGFPTWYHYLPGVDGSCDPNLRDLGNIWLIVAALIEILLRVAVLAAVAMVIYGSITYVTSQGEAESTAKARNTIVNALIGLAIAIMAAVIVNFIAGKLQQS
jgi:hypothetical protein